MKCLKFLYVVAGLLLSVGAGFAQSGTTGSLTWNLSGGTLTISGSGAMPDYEWHSAPWYEYKESINTLTIGTAVTTIGEYAFEWCALTSVSIPSSVTTIGEGAFSNCRGLTSITIPSSVTTIKIFAFYSCSGLTSITIPSGVTRIENGAFGDCSNLTSIDVENGNSAYSSDNGVLFDKNKTTLIYCPKGKTGTYVIPNSVTTIGEWAFEGCLSLTSITIPRSVTTIGNHAFDGCNSLTSIIIPSSVTKIEYYAFTRCGSLTSITIPSSVTKIGSGAFDFCNSLTSITNLNPVPVEIKELNVFGEVNQSACTLKVPMGSVSAYQNAEVWKEFNIVGVEVGIETLETATIKIYPNPTTRELRIESGELRIESVVMYDMFGKIQNIGNWKTEGRIDVSHLSAGVYFVKISTDAGEVTRKVVKE